MKSTVLSFLVLSAVFFNLPAFAEYYHYVDENGVRHYTDDLSEVPVHDLPVIDVIDEVEADSLPAGVEPALEERGLEEKEPERSLSSGGDGQGGWPDAEALSRAKKDLDEIYAELLRKKDALLKSKNRLSEKAYQDKVSQLNGEIENYREQNSKFKKRVERYNKKVLNNYRYN